jgi:hypothetical protein
MKTPARLLPALSVSVVSLTLLSGCVAPAASVGLSHSVTSVERFGKILAKRGDSMSDVRLSMGPPLRHLTPNLWTYPDFHGGEAQHPSDDCSILLVMFTEGHVSDLKLVNHRAQAIIVTQIHEMNARTQLANR